jgi:predicted lipid-binding transport protein (Tim44 family)
MNQRTIKLILMVVTAAVGLLYLWHDTAEAARLGGGKSFGSRPSYQRSAPAPSSSPTSPQMRPGQPAQPGPVAGPTPSPMGRWGGMLGGLLMGGLIGSLLFGGGHAYGGPGLLDLAILGGGLFLLFRFLRARRMAAESPATSGPMSFDRGPAQEWGSSSYDPSSEPVSTGVEQPSIPAGFDQKEFLKGAKAIYTRLQASWDKRDLDDIRQFASPEVFEEIQRQVQQDPNPGKTELILINPRILEVRDIDGRTVASVLYDVMMRENRDEMTKQVRELWHFSRDANKPDAFWVLEGIQQVEG